jgi:DNA-binding response OmpR family regulator
MNQQGTNHHLMVVEDDPGARRALGAIFSSRGWTVRSAATVAEAEDLLEHDPEPEALILDLMLPDGSGDAVLRKVRAAGLGTHVMVCTGSTDPRVMMRVRALKPDLLLIKPLGAEVLYNLCTHWTSMPERR